MKTPDARLSRPFIVSSLFSMRWILSHGHGTSSASPSAAGFPVFFVWIADLNWLASSRSLPLRLASRGRVVDQVDGSFIASVDFAVDAQDTEFSHHILVANYALALGCMPMPHASERSPLIRFSRAWERCRSRHPILKQAKAE